jgi:hypothetical protein
MGTSTEDETGSPLRLAGLNFACRTASMAALTRRG